MYDPDVVEPAMFDRVEDGDDAGCMYLDADHIEIRRKRRHFNGRLPVAKADVEYNVAVASEDVDPIEHRTIHAETPSLDPRVELGLALWRQRPTPHFERRSRSTNHRDLVVFRRRHEAGR